MYQEISENEREDIRFYCGVNEHQWNRIDPAPGRYACVAPVYGRSTRTREISGVTLPKNTRVIQDSGAFSDSQVHRLDPGAALERQCRHAEKYGYADQITHRASYDRMIDEQWDLSGTRHKQRWSELDAEDAVNETIRAARYLSRNLERSATWSGAQPGAERKKYGAILSAQGVTPQQYLRCACSVMKYWEPGDILGLGGWCITGKYPAQIGPVFDETMRIIVPVLAKAGINWLHVWGVCYAPALRTLRMLCDEYGIDRISVDSASPQLRPSFGRWGYKGWSDLNYQRPPVELRGPERARHVEATRQWLATFRDQCDEDGAKQLRLW